MGPDRVRERDSQPGGCFRARLAVEPDSGDRRLPGRTIPTPSVTTPLVAAEREACRHSLHGTPRVPLVHLRDTAPIRDGPGRLDLGTAKGGLPG
jgi:hypothetical protein